MENKMISMSVIEDIRTEIENIEINGMVDEHTMFIRNGEQVKNIALEIIDKKIQNNDTKENEYERIIK